MKFLSGIEIFQFFASGYLKAIVFTKFLKAGVNFSRAEIAVGLRFITLKNPVQI